MWKKPLTSGKIALTFKRNPLHNIFQFNLTMVIWVCSSLTSGQSQLAGAEGHSLDG